MARYFDAVSMFVALAVLAGLAALLLATRHRRPNMGVSRETVRRDRSPNPFLERPVSSREIERAATEAFRASRTAVVPRPQPPILQVPPVDAELIGVTRRQFFNRSAIAMTALGLSGFASAVLAFLWPRPSSAFGSKVGAGRLDDLLQRIDDTREPVYLSQARTYISRYPKEALDKARGSYPQAVVPGLEAGVVALYQKCPHLGCRVPFCGTSQWFECPCHGSQYTRAGEKKGGPAPRGMDLFPVSLEGGAVTVDTGLVIQGMPVGTNTTGQEAEGPHCVSARAE